MLNIREKRVLDAIIKLSYEYDSPCVRFTNIVKKCNFHRAVVARILRKMIKLREIYKCPNGGYMRVWPNEHNFIESEIVIEPIELKNPKAFVAEVLFKGTLLNNTFKELSRIFIEVYGDLSDRILKLKINNEVYEIDLKDHKLSENLYTYIHLLREPVPPGSVLNYEYKFYLIFSGKTDTFSFKVLSPTIKFKLEFIRKYKEIRMDSIKFAGFQPTTVLKLFKELYKNTKRHVTEILYIPKFSLINIIFKFN